MPSAVHQLVNSKRDLDLIACSWLESSTSIIESEDIQRRALWLAFLSPFTSLPHLANRINILIVTRKSSKIDQIISFIPYPLTQLTKNPKI